LTNLHRSRKAVVVSSLLDVRPAENDQHDQQFLDHLTKDAMPPLIERLSSSAD